MRFELNDTSKIATFWLTNAERNDTNVLAELKTQCSMLNDTKYTVAVFYSGRESLCELTEGLLLHNNKLS
jgi:hypothetical protein